MGPLGIDLSSIADVLFVAILLWVGIVWLKRTHARLALPGIVVLGGLYFLAERFNLQLTIWIFQGFFAVFALVMIVVFQEDLRRLLESISTWSLRRRTPIPTRGAVEVVVRVAAQFAQEKIGALLIFPGRTPLERHLEGGVYLGGRVSEPLLMSLFDPSSPGHDGAVLLRGNRIERFAIHLPLSTDWDRIGPGGTRHAAALGVAERSDALCVAVSEERGTISVAHDGELHVLTSPEALHRALTDFVQRAAPHTRNGGHEHVLMRRIALRWREGLLAVALAAGIWFLSIPGTALTEVHRSVPVEVENLPEGYRLSRVEPAEVEVTLGGRRRDILLTGSHRVRVRIDALLVQLGRKTFQVSEESIEHPENLRFIEVLPRQVKVIVEREEPDP